MLNRVPTRQFSGYAAANWMAAHPSPLPKLLRPLFSIVDLGSIALACWRPSLLLPL